MSSEYGWDDEQILNLTLKRLRQVVAAIKRRLYFEERRQKSLISWQTRHITQFIAAGYMVDSKKGNPALDEASKLAFDEIESMQLEEAAQDIADRPIGDSLKPGTYEQMFGLMQQGSKPR